MRRIWTEWDWLRLHLCGLMLLSLCTACYFYMLGLTWPTIGMLIGLAMLWGSHFMMRTRSGPRP